MSFFMTKLMRRKIVPVLRIEGPVTELVVSAISKHLNNIPYKQAQALGVIINSQGGSPVQCNLLRTKLKLYTQKYNIPLIMFSERHALSGGYYIMTAGQKLIVQSACVLGNLGVQRDWKTFKVQKDPFDMDNFDYDDFTYEYHYDILQGLNEKHEIKWANTTIDLMNKKIQKEVRHARELKQGNWIMNKITIGQKAVDLGMADEVSSVNEYFQKEYPKCRIICHSHKSKFEAFVEKIHKWAVLMKSRAFYFVVTLFLCKVIIKWTLIIYLWRKSKIDKDEQKNQQIIEDIIHKH